MKICSKHVLIMVLTVVISLMAFGGQSYASENGLVAHYKFSNDFNDSSGNNNNGSVLGDVSIVDDETAGKCALFNGGYVNILSKPALNLGNRFTISTWILVDPVKGAGNKTLPIATKLDDRGLYNVYQAYARGTFGARFDARLTLGGDYLVQNGAFDNYATSSSWTHIVFSCDGQRFYLYVNGALKGTSGRVIQSGAGIQASNGPMRIGTTNNINNKNLYFPGKMADFRLYNRALSADEIQALADAGVRNGQ